MDSTPRMLRDLMQGEAPVVVPFAHDALSARMIERAGFKAVGASGSGMTASLLAVPDIGLTSMTEMVEQTARIVQAITLPVIADADDGHGNHVNAWRTAHAFERAGVAGLFIEDQHHPKRCGHYQGTRVVPVSTMVGKLHAVLDARCDPDLVVIARTDARQSLGLDEAIDRGNRYREAGADVVFVEAPLSQAELLRVAREVPGPLMVNMVEGGRTPLFSPAELGAMGFRIIIWPDTAIAAATLAMERVLATLARDGTSTAVSDALMPFARMREVLQHEFYGRIDARYGDEC